ncbi:MAG: type II toxin-antitoxin system RelE/ParE family toxin [Planctomycetaceae bacterium]|nr:type II toxin-antitoxin system RelE/ParE family toxin [Planctomycetaceae bacterium]
MDRARIADDPTSYPCLVGPYRSLRVRRFPYRLIYLVEDPDLILILAVAHTGRRPGYWQRRKRNP